MGLGENIKTLRRDRGMTQEQLADHLGVGPTSVSNWERGEAEPIMGRVRAMSELFGVSMTALTGDRNPLIAREDRAPYGNCPTAPLYGKIAAGTPIEQLPVDDELWMPPEVKRDHPRGFYLEVKGESMNRVLPNGVFAVIDPDAQYVDGAVMAVTVDGNDATIKRVYQGSESTTLAPDSYDPRFEEQRFAKPDSEEIKPIGRVVWWVPRYDRRF